MRDDTKRQHFVPTFYLRRFANDDGQIEVLDLQRQVIGKQRPYSSVCYKNFFYAVTEGVRDDASQAFENYFGDIEDAVSKDWDNRIGRALTGQILEGDFLALARFIAMLMLRTASNRENFHKNRNRSRTKLLRSFLRSRDLNDPKIQQEFCDIVGKNYSINELKIIRDAAAETEFPFPKSNASYLRFILTQLHEFTNVIAYQHWTIYRATGSAKFITSENPVLEWSPKRVGFLPPGRLAYNQYIAISPDILIKAEPLSPSENFEIDEEVIVGTNSFDIVDYYDSSDFDVMVYNYLLTGQGTRFAYAQQRDTFEKMLEESRSAGPAYQLFRVAFGL